jgi:LmbE family N-acetylglucosaminyl deacetylase
MLKIVIFEPHPDDLLFGTGPKIFDWIEEGHNVHIITVTDGRAAYRDAREIDMPEDEVAEMRINEAKRVIEFLGLNKENHHLLFFHDAVGKKYVKEGIERVKPIISNADRIVLPSNNNLHEDHQATHDIAIEAAKDLNLDIEISAVLKRIFIFTISTFGFLVEKIFKRPFAFQFFNIDAEKLKNGEWEIEAVISGREQ